jgi:hypothetical protein
MVICAEGDGFKYIVNDIHKVMTTLILCSVHVAFMSSDIMVTFKMSF